MPRDHLMAQFQVRGRFVIFSTLGLFLSAVIGCGGPSSATVVDDPTAAEKQKEARYAAYGKAGIPTSKGNQNSQAAARRRGR